MHRSVSLTLLSALSLGSLSLGCAEEPLGETSATTSTGTTTSSITSTTGSVTGTSTTTSTTGVVTDGELGVTATVADVQTVINVSWITEVETTGYVRFGETDAYGLTTNTTDLGTEHEVLLLGNPADTEVHFEVVTDNGLASGDLTITTGSLPSGFPTLATTGVADQWAYQVLPVQGSAFAIAVVDNLGRVVWYDQLEPDGNLMRAMISADRQSMIYCMAGPQSDLSIGEIVWVSLDGSERVAVPLPYVDHDITELPDGTIAAIVVTDDPAGGSKAADRLVEMTRDGELTEIWNAWEKLDMEFLMEELRDDYNVTHGNGLDYVPEEDAYYMSMKAPGSVAKIDRSTGQTQWIINGILNEFTFPKGAEIVQMQHQLERIDGGLMVFDNGLQDRGYSRAVELALDEENLLAEQTWEYIRDPSVYVYAKGDVARFADGTRQVVWSTSGEIQNVTEDGEVVWQLNSELGQAITFVQILDDLYVR